MNNFKHISSADNNQFKQLRKLAGSARDRRKQNQTLLDGVHLITALADSPFTPELIAIQEGREQEAEIQHCLKLFPNTRHLLLSRKLFEALSPVETPTGILAVLDIPESETKPFQCGVLLENIQDPGNLGSIMRTAAAAGADAVFLSKGCAEAWSPKAMRAAMGAHFTLAIFEQQDLVETCDHFKMVVATHLQGTQSLYDLDLTQSVAFLFGNEGAGLSDELSARATHRIRIPMPGKVESLNVAAAAAVCLFEKVRQTSH